MHRQAGKPDLHELIPQISIHRTSGPMPGGNQSIIRNFRILVKSFRRRLLTDSAIGFDGPGGGVWNGWPVLGYDKAPRKRRSVSAGSSCAGEKSPMIPTVVV